MDTLLLRDLVVNYHIGVPDEERRHSQRLLISVELEHDFSAAAASDDLKKTIDYYAMSRRLIAFGEGRSWKLIETLAVDIAALCTGEFGAAAATVEVKKFIIAEARYVAARVRRERE